MKRLAVLLVAVLATAAFAGVQDFGKFTVDVADGWTATQNGPTAVITKNDNTAALSITVSPAEAPIADLAKAFAAEFSKSFATVSTPEADSDGDYSWDMVNAAGVNTHAMLHVEDGDYILITMTGVEAAGDEISAMLGSVKDK